MTARGRWVPIQTMNRFTALSVQLFRLRRRLQAFWPSPGRLREQSQRRPNKRGQTEEVLNSAARLSPVPERQVRVGSCREPSQRSVSPDHESKNENLLQADQHLPGQMASSLCGPEATKINR